MESIPAHTLQSSPIPDQATLRARLEETRTAFHRLLDSSTGDRWREKSPTSAWTYGEVLVHLTGALEYLPAEIVSARKGKGMFNLPKWLADPGSYWLTRWEARAADPQSVRRRYDAAMDAVIAAIATVPDADWHLGAQFYGEGFYTVADLFDTPSRHLAEHAGQP